VVSCKYIVGRFLAYLPIFGFNCEKMEKSGRSKNFFTNEINLLVMLVDSNKKVVESKKTGTVTNKEKAKMWEKNYSFV
jgi:hypothetical protein